MTTINVLLMKIVHEIIFIVRIKLKYASIKI